MHIADVTKGMLGANGIVGAGAPIAVGAGITAKGTGNVSIAFSGDGACNQGTTFEAMNMAVVLKLPVIFVFENNHYSEHTGESYAVGAESMTTRAAAFGMKAIKANGIDFFSVYEAIARRAMALLRSSWIANASLGISKAIRSAIAARASWIGCARSAIASRSFAPR